MNRTTTKLDAPILGNNLKRHGPRRWHRALRSTVAVLCSWSLIYCVPAHADLASEMNNFFSQSGALSNVTAPGAFRAQGSNVLIGGDMQLRFPIQTHPLYSFSPPHLRSGCGGIDAYLGSFSGINGQQFKQMLQQIGNNSVGLLFMAALKSIDPLIASTLEYLQSASDKLNSLNRSTCSYAELLVQGVTGVKTGNATQTCMEIATTTLGMDRQAAQEKCKATNDRSQLNQQAAASPDPSTNTIPVRTQNLVWSALEGTSLSHEAKEMFMNITGSVIVYGNDAEAKQQGIEGGSLYLEPTLSLARALVVGDQIDPSNADRVLVKSYWKCNAGSKCIHPNAGTLAASGPIPVDLTRIDQSITPFTILVQQMLVSIRNKMVSNSGTLTPEEVAFINMTSVPVYRMLTLAYLDDTDATFNALLAAHLRLIAVEYAYNFVQINSKFVLQRLGAIVQNDKTHETKETQLRTDIRANLEALDREKQLLVGQATAYAAVTANLQEIERRLHTNMPANMKAAFEFAGTLKKRS